MQQGKPMALKYLERFPIEIYSKHIQWGLQNLQSYKICSKLTIKTPERCQLCRFGTMLLLN